MTDDGERFRQLVRNILETGALQRLVFSRPVDRSEHVARRIVIRPVDVRQGTMLQWTRRIGTQERHENQSVRESLQAIDAIAGREFQHVNLFATTGRWSARFTRKGRCLLHQEANFPDAGAADEPPANAHNRERQFIIESGRPVPFLVATGVMNEDGHVRNRHSRKFRQINRYVEFIADIVDRLPPDETIRVVDFGCGRSYLTFATHHYLTRIAGREVDITGLERRSDIVQSCREMAERLELSDIHFEQADIAEFDADDRHVHLAISLHACDTATDDALFQAVRWGADVILAVPCCQHELAAKIARDSLPAVLRHGILNDRFCAMTTDAVRAALLERVGWQTRVVEFIDMEHTAKNVLIRAIRRRSSATADHVAGRSAELRQLKHAFALPALRLERQLTEAGFLPSADDEHPGRRNAE